MPHPRRGLSQKALSATRLEKTMDAYRLSRVNCRNTHYSVTGS
jgi:hypothetical protein